MFSSPARNCKFRMLRMIAACHMIVVLHQHLAISRNEHRAKWFIAKLKRSLCQLYAALQILYINLLNYAKTSFIAATNMLSHFGK